jgi:hypothetical protein
MYRKYTKNKLYNELALFTRFTASNSEQTLDHHPNELHINFLRSDGEKPQKAAVGPPPGLLKNAQDIIKPLSRNIQIRFIYIFGS